MPLPLGERFPSKVLMGAGARPEELGHRKRIHWNMGTQYILHVLGETPIDVIYCNHVKTVDSLTKIAEILQEAVNKNEQPFGLKTPKPFKVLILDHIYEILQELQSSSLETYHTTKIAASIGESLSKVFSVMLAGEIGGFMQQNELFCEIFSSAADIGFCETFHQPDASSGFAEHISDIFRC